MAENLPAVPTPTDLDGWTSGDVLAHLARLELSFKRGRLEVGLLLWKLRTLEPSDPAYGAKVAPLAERFDVTMATLGRWRQAAEEQFGLTKAVDRPKNETAGQNGSVARPRATEKAVTDITSKPKPKSNNGSGIATIDVAKQEPPMQLAFDFEAADHAALVGLGKKRLMGVQKRISEALRYAR